MCILPSTAPGLASPWSSWSTQLAPRHSERCAQGGQPCQAAQSCQSTEAAGRTQPPHHHRPPPRKHIKTRLTAGRRPTRKSGWLRRARLRPGRRTWRPCQTRWPSAWCRASARRRSTDERTCCCWCVRAARAGCGARQQQSWCTGHLCTWGAACTRFRASLIAADASPAAEHAAAAAEQVPACKRSLMHIAWPYLTSSLAFNPRRATGLPGLALQRRPGSPAVAPAGQAGGRGLSQGHRARRRHAGPAGEPSPALPLRAGAA